MTVLVYDQTFIRAMHRLGERRPALLGDVVAALDSIRRNPAAAPVVTRDIRTYVDSAGRFRIGYSWNRGVAEVYVLSLNTIP